VNPPGTRARRPGRLPTLLSVDFSQPAIGDPGFGLANRLCQAGLHASGHPGHREFVGLPGAPREIVRVYLTCPETSLVISNMLTCFLPPKTTFSASSALIKVRFFSSWSLFFLI